MPSADYIVRVLDGRIDCQGSPNHLRSSGELEGIVAVDKAITFKEEVIAATEVPEIVEEEKKKEKKKGPGRKLIKDEERAVGNVKWKTYKFYIESASYITWILWIVTVFLAQFTSIAESVWLKVWGEAYKIRVDTFFTFFKFGATGIEEHLHSDHRQNFLYHGLAAVNATAPALVVQGGADVLANPQYDFPPAQTHPGYYLTVYTIIVLGSALISVISSMIGAWGSYRASRKIHDDLLNSVAGSTIRFFNTTPLGRILNRFSKDIQSVDNSMNSILRTVVTMVAGLISKILIVGYIIPWFLIPAALISYIYYRYALIYLRTGRSLRRLEATLRSPIFSGFAELLDGVVSVRAFGVERRFFEILCEQVDKSKSASYFYWMTNRWVSTRSFKADSSSYCALTCSAACQSSSPQSWS